MDLYYWKTTEGNFGDDLNQWLWDALLPGWREWDPKVTLVGVGTIFNTVNFPDDRLGRFLVMGSGAGYGMPPNLTLSGRSFDIRALRGPRSARNVGLAESLGVVDPAVMITRLATFRSVPATKRTIFVPHESSVNRHPWAQICADLDIDYVSPCGESHDVIRKIAGSSLVIAESMHAAIIADAFRVPWRGIRLTEGFNLDKWLDWGESLQLVPDVRPLLPMMDSLMAFRRRRKSPSPKASGVGARGVHTPSLKRQLRLAVERPMIPGALKAQLQLPPQLSDGAILNEQQDRYQAILDAVSRDYG